MPQRTIDLDDAHYDEFIALQPIPLPNLREETAPVGAVCGWPGHGDPPPAATVRITFDTLDAAGQVQGGTQE